MRLLHTYNPIPVPLKETLAGAALKETEWIDADPHLAAPPALGVSLQGLFRIAAGASKLKKLKAALDCSTSQLEEFYSDPHAVAGASSSKSGQECLREAPGHLSSWLGCCSWRRLPLIHRLC